jgi:uncharacterized protein YndB with AHSA1/START domain
MDDPRALNVSARGDCEIAMSRAFDAPRNLVYDAYTKPELVKRWLLGPPGWTMPVCEIDLRVGGAFRFVWRKEADGREMGMGGFYQVVVTNEKIVNTEKFDDPWYPGDAVNTTTFVEQRGRTTLTMTVRYDTRETRDMVLRSPMESGVAASFDRLEAILETPASQR